MMTVVHAVQWPLACAWGWVAGAISRRRGLSWPEAYALALAPGLLIAIAAIVFGPAHAPSNEQPWQGLIIWAAWSALGVFLGIRKARKAKTTTIRQ
jgi:hypothetical protein